MLVTDGLTAAADAARVTPGESRDAPLFPEERRLALFPPLLRELRFAGGYTLEDAAAVIRCDRSKISRMESGKRGIRAVDAAALIHAYGVRGREFSALSRMLTDSRRDWWDTAPQLMTGDFHVYALLELAASRILVYQPAGVPGLLQVPAWARAAVRRQPGIAAGEEEAAVTAVAARQDAVLNRPGGPSLDVILGAPFPGRDDLGPEAARQYARLRGRPGIAVRFLPAAETWLACAGPFTILEFDSGPASGFAYQPGPAGGFLTADPGTVEAFTDLFAVLGRRASPSPGRSGVPPQARRAAAQLPESGIDAEP